ncbi:hypothetical protein D9613_012538 [Agrocybe pediades]|uniref:Uncharacterized protein n=1 Tax=Agrocybe pediades TaxID=84607 RepID=A0A8H4QR30_9AGAR|nr:hypothetical protein D9613_012538 [Agrocybe pediades]
MTERLVGRDWWGTSARVQRYGALDHRDRCYCHYSFSSSFKTPAGTRIVLKCTVPQGNGSMSMISFVDGKMDTQVMRQSRDNTAFYDDVWFDSNFTAGPHELVIQNTGGALDSPFQLDRFIVTGSVIPVSAQPGVPTTTTQSSTSSTSQGRTTSISKSSSSPSSIAGLVTVTESSTTFTLIIATDGSVQTLGVAPSTGSGSHSSRNTGAIVGGVLGGIACLLFLVLILLRIRRRNSMVPTQHLAQRKGSEANGHK